MRRRLPRAFLALAVTAAATLTVGVATTGPASALGNGLALTPPMGWNDWNSFGCNVSAQLVEQTADTIVSSGMRDAGYQYVNIDDCWMAPARSASGHLVPDPAKFPGGITAVANYVHGRGLKLGIYESAGTATCAGYPGSLDHERTDAADFAAWGVDYLKYDNCNNQGRDYHQRYEAMRDALAATGRPIVYSLCEWGQENVWNWGAGTGNLWRTTDDIQATYASMLSIVHSQEGFARYAGPGGWNDPDMLEVGNGMSDQEDRAEFSLWSIMAAPLIAGNDLRSASAGTLGIYTNRRVIAVDQDPLGRQGVQVQTANGLDVLAKPLSGGDVAVVLFNENAGTATITTDVATVGKSGAGSYGLTDLWSGATSSITGTISASVPGHGVAMYRVSGGSAAAPAAPANNLVSAASGRCLDDPGWSRDDGARIEIWDCNGGANQLWTRTPAGQLVVYGKCLDAYDNRTAPGTAVELWTCNGGRNQQWRVNADGSITGVQSGLCLDVTGAATDNGTTLELWTCHGGANQRWTAT
jgi:alpha-galactosidase